jgi:hypothetical protein
MYWNRLFGQHCQNDKNFDWGLGTVGFIDRYFGNKATRFPFCDSRINSTGFSHREEELAGCGSD